MLDLDSLLSIFQRVRKCLVAEEWCPIFARAQVFLQFCLDLSPSLFCLDNIINWVLNSVIVDINLMSFLLHLINVSNVV